MDATAQPLRRGIGLGQIDYYILKPWRAADELFHRTVTEFLHEWVGSDASLSRELTIVADAGNARASELRSLLTRNRVPFVFHAASSPRGSQHPRGRPTAGRGRAGRRPAQRPCPGRPLQHRDRQRVRRQHQPPRIARVRRHGRRRRTLRARRRRVRLLRGIAHPRDRTRDDRWPGRLEFPDPQLPGLPARHHRRRPRDPCPAAGLGVRARRSSRCARPWPSDPTETGSTSRRRTAPRFRPASSSSPWGSATGAWASPPSTSSPGRASSTAPPRPRPSDSPAARSSSSAPATPPARPPSTWPATPERSRSWSAARRPGRDDVALPHRRDRGAARTSTSATGPRSWTDQETGQLETLTLRDSATGETETVPADAVFILIGAQPAHGMAPDLR